MSGPVHAPQAPRRSRARKIAFVVWLVVFLIAAVPTVWTAISYSSQPEDQHVPAAGGDVTIEDTGEYAVYAESSRSSTGNWAGLTSITGPSGAQVPVSGSGIQENYNVNDRVATRIGTFTATEPGTYRLVGDDRGTAPGDELVVSTRTVGSVLGIVFGSIATGLVLVAGLIGGLVLFLVGRRRTPPPVAWPAGAPASWPGPYGAGPNPYGPPPGGPYGPPQQYAAPQGGQYATPPGGQYGGTPAGLPPAGTAPAGAAAPSAEATPQDASSQDPTVTVHPPEGTDGRT